MRSHTPLVARARLAAALALPLALGAPLASALLSPPDARADDAAAGRAALRRARSEADDLLRKAGLASDEKKREEYGARFDAVDIRARIPSLLEALKPDRATGSQRFAVGRLRALGIPEVAPHLVFLATTPGVKKEARDDAHAAALALHAEATRRWDEHVVANDLGKRRLLALGRVADIASPDSVPLLTKVLATVGLEVHLQVSQLQSFASVPVNLGSANGAATQVPIQLPAISLIDVHVNSTVPAEMQVAVRGETLRALRSIAGDLGEDPAKYAAWYDARKAEQKKAGGSPAAPTSTASPAGSGPAR